MKLQCCAFKVPAALIGLSVCSKAEAIEHGCGNCTTGTMKQRIYMFQSCCSCRLCRDAPQQLAASYQAAAGET